MPKKYTRQNPGLLNSEQAGRLLASLPHYWRTLIFVLVLTGIRWSEATGLRWQDIDLRRRVLFVNGNNWKGRWQPTPKTEVVDRDIPLTDPLPDLLAAHRRQQVATQHPGLAAGWVFPTARGTLHKGSPLRSVLDKACTELELPRITTHGLRRTFNDQARKLAQGMVVRAILGHTSEAMTAHYSHIALEEKRAATDAVARTFLAEAVANRVVGIRGGDPADETDRIPENPEGSRGGATRI